MSGSDSAENRPAWKPSRVYTPATSWQKSDVMLHRQHRLVLAASLIFAAIPAMPWIGAAGMRIAVRADPERLTWSYFRRVDSMSGTSEHARIAAEMSFPQPLRIERAEGEYRLPQFTITVTPQPARTVARRSE